MNDEQRKRQRGAIQATYRRMLNSEQLERLHPDDGKSLHLWTTQTLGVLCSSITTLEDCELNALRDALNGKPLRVHQRLRDLLSKTKSSPDGYAIHIARATHADRLMPGGKYDSIESLPYVVAYKILQQEETRAGAYRKPHWKRLPRAGVGTRVSKEQASLWGM